MNNKIEVFKAALAAIIILAFFGMILILMLFPVPETNSNILYLLTGFLGGSGFAIVVGYYFGSSHGSKIKTDIMANAQPKNGENLPNEDFGINSAIG